MKTRQINQPKFDIIKIYKALADKTRFQIALNLSGSTKELTCSELAQKFDLSQPAFSHHCKKLTQAGILKTRKEGPSHYLSIDNDLLKIVGINLSELYKQSQVDYSNIK